MTYLCITQWNTDELANGIYEAMSMDRDQRAVNHEKLFRYVTKYTAAEWGLAFLSELARIKRAEDRKQGVQIQKMDNEPTPPARRASQAAEA